MVQVDVTPIALHLTVTGEAPCRALRLVVQGMAHQPRRLPLTGMGTGRERDGLDTRKRDASTRRLRAYTVTSRREHAG